MLGGPPMRGGAPMEQPGKRVQGASGTVDFFLMSAACCVLMAGLVGFIGTMLTSRLFDLIDNIYLLFFGSIMFVLDNPANFQGLVQAQRIIFKYCKFLEMFTGKGLWYMFLGTMVFATLWTQNIWSFGGFVLGLWVFGIGAFATVLGVTKSRKLERVRTEAYAKKADVQQLYTHYARAYPRDGMTGEEFDIMVMQVSGIQFTPTEIDSVFNALASGRNGQLLTPSDLQEWVHSGSEFCGIPRTLL